MSKKRGKESMKKKFMKLSSMLAVAALSVSVIAG